MTDSFASRPTPRGAALRRWNPASQRRLFSRVRGRSVASGGQRAIRVVRLARRTASAARRGSSARREGGGTRRERRCTATMVTARKLLLIAPAGCQHGCSGASCAAGEHKPSPPPVAAGDPRLAVERGGIAGSRRDTRGLSGGAGARGSPALGEPRSRPSAGRSAQLNELIDGAAIAALGFGKTKAVHDRRFAVT
jgi:hypothetical protein